MKKVLFISLMDGAPWGGSEFLWNRLAVWMAENGFEVSVCVYDWDENRPRLEEFRKKRLQVSLMPRKKSWISSFKLKKALKAIEFEKYELVFVNQGGYKEVVYPPFERLWQRMNKYVLASHNYDESERLSERKIRALKEWTSHAALQVGASAKIFEALNRNFGVPQTRQEVWINPISFEPPLMAPPYPGPIQGNYIFSMLAELDVHRKAQDLLFHTLAAEKWSDRNWQLHLYGKGKDMGLLQNLAAEKGLQDKVIFKGFVAEPREALANSHVLIQCSRIDAMPVSVVEAMAMGRPCVISTVGDMPLWIREGENGFVCNELTMDALDRTLERCWSKREEWAAIGKSAYQTFKSKYPIPYEETLLKRVSLL